MALQPGDSVRRPENGEPGIVLEVITNPACLMRVLRVRWQSGEIEEREELDFGPLRD